MSTAIRFLAAFIAVFLTHMLLYSLLLFVPVGVQEWQELQGRTPADPLYWPWNQVSHLLETLFFLLLYWFLVPSRRLGASLLFGFLLGAYVCALELGNLVAVKVMSAPIAFATMPIILAAAMLSSVALAYMLPHSREERT